MVLEDSSVTILDHQKTEQVGPRRTEVWNIPGGNRAKQKLSSFEHTKRQKGSFEKMIILGKVQVVGKEEKQVWEEFTP